MILAGKCPASLACEGGVKGHNIKKIIHHREAPPVRARGFTKIGMITIGQSPRIDIIPEMREVLGTEVEILEAGALDGLTLEEVKKFYPKGRDYILCTRMSDGTEVVVAKRFIVPRVSEMHRSSVPKGSRDHRLYLHRAVPSVLIKETLRRSPKDPGSFYFSPPWREGEDRAAHPSLRPDQTGEEKVWSTEGKDGHQSCFSLCLRG